MTGITGGLSMMTRSATSRNAAKYPLSLGRFPEARRDWVGSVLTGAIGATRNPGTWSNGVLKRRVADYHRGQSDIVRQSEELMNPGTPEVTVDENHTLAGLCHRDRQVRHGGRLALSGDRTA